MKADIKLSYTDLIKHALLDSYEFSSHSTDGVWSTYQLNGIGMSFFVNFDQEAVLNNLKSNNDSKAVFAHTHPLVNDTDITFEKDKLDPRIRIAYGELPLPLGNPPTDGDISFLDTFKKKAKKGGVDASGAVFVASGIWTFDINPHMKIDIEKLKERNKPDKDSGVGDFFEDEILKGEFPDYFMEVEKPAMHDEKYKNVDQSTLIARVRRNDKEVGIAQKDYGERIQNYKKYYAECGVILDFLPYNSNGIDPTSLMRECIEEWERKFL